MTGGPHSDPVTQALERAEAALAAGRTLAHTGFWRAVDRLRRDPDLAARHAERVGAVERRAFERAVRLRAPLWLGLLLLTLGSGGGGLAVALAPQAGRWRWLPFLAGTGLLLLCTHSLTHWAVGRACGIRFTHVFLGGPPPPRPGVKVDYASYLVTPPLHRAVMHASGAVVTKLVPFALLPVGAASGMPGWVLAVLGALGVVQIATDVLFSTRSSDWKRTLRELRAARAA